MIKRNSDNTGTILECDICKHFSFIPDDGFNRVFRHTSSCMNESSDYICSDCLNDGDEANDG